MQSIDIIAINDNDFDILLSPRESYQRFYEVDIPEAVTLNTWTRFSEPVEPMFAALAVVDGQASGLVHSIYHRSAGGQWVTTVILKTCLSRVTRLVTVLAGL